jgi:glutaredoxin
MKHGPVKQHLLMALACTLLTLPSWAQYKVVQPDGSVIYTDRPPAGNGARVTPVGPARPAVARPGAAAPVTAAASAEALAAGLPSDLRTVVLRYPVTLYSTVECTACDNGRKLLQQRGIPHTERQVLNDDDIRALEKLLGSRNVPVLAIGPQSMRGFAEADWQNYLDAAGYPRESRLPKGWKAAAAAPLAPRVQAPAAAPDEPARPATPAAAALPPASPAPGGLRF